MGETETQVHQPEGSKGQPATLMVPPLTRQSTPHTQDDLAQSELTSHSGWRESDPRSQLGRLELYP
jgi:hypothetical protein